VRAFIQPCPALQPLTLTERAEVTVRGTSAVAGLDRGIAARQARKARQLLERADLGPDIDEESWDGGPGSVLVLRAEADGVPATFVGLGARGKPAEVVAEEAVAELLAFVRAGQGAVDPHSADQLVLPLAFAEGPSEYTTSEVTLHLTTNIGIVRRFVERDIVCEGAEGGPGRVVVR
jgi:RNA 3'-terminal phosphate cyclase (ATP)